MWLCYPKSKVGQHAFFIANTKDQVVKMMENHWLRTWFDQGELKEYPMDYFNITNFKELRKEKYWLVFTKESGDAEDHNSYYSDMVICNKKENVLDTYRSMNDISDSVPDDVYDFIEMVPIEKYWGIYDKLNPNIAGNMVTGDTEEEAMNKHTEEKGAPDASCYAYREFPYRENFNSWE